MYAQIVSAASPAQAGVAVVIASGDSKGAVQTVAKEIGLPRPHIYSGTSRKGREGGPGGTREHRS
jgi:soluble P-type ATPase